MRGIARAGQQHYGSSRSSPIENFQPHIFFNGYEFDSVFGCVAPVARILCPQCAHDEQSCGRKKQTFTDAVHLVSVAKSHATAPSLPPDNPPDPNRSTT